VHCRNNNHFSTKQFWNIKYFLFVTVDIFSGSAAIKHLEAMKSFSSWQENFRPSSDIQVFWLKVSTAIYKMERGQFFVPPLPIRPTSCFVIYNILSKAGQAISVVNLFCQNDELQHLFYRWEQGNHPYKVLDMCCGTVHSRGFKGTTQRRELDDLWEKPVHTCSR
jgi:hypothetical protein